MMAQLDFLGALFQGEPWDGASPRVLTRGHLARILQPQGAKARAIYLDPLQYELWPPVVRARGSSRAPSSVGAETLLPLPKEDK